MSVMKSNISSWLHHGCRFVSSAAGNTVAQLQCSGQSNHYTTSLETQTEREERSLWDAYIDSISRLFNRFENSLWIKFKMHCRDQRKCSPMMAYDLREMTEIYLICIYLIKSWMNHSIKQLFWLIRFIRLTNVSLRFFSRMWQNSLKHQNKIWGTKFWWIFHVLVTF